MNQGTQVLPTIAVMAGELPESSPRPDLMAVVDMQYVFSMSVEPINH